MSVRECATKFIAEHFGIQRSVFDAAWEFASRQEILVRQRGHNVSPVLSGKIETRLGVAGPEDSEAIRTIIVFVGADKALERGVSGHALIETIQRLCSTYETNERLTRRLLESLETFLSQQALADKKVGRFITASESEEYCQMWSRDPARAGEWIGKNEFDRIHSEKNTFDVFIIDEGDCERGTVGEVWMTSRLHNASRTTGEECWPVAKVDMGPLHYRILVHTLRKGGVAGGIVEIAEACWRDDDFARELRRMEDEAGGALKGGSDKRGRGGIGPVVSAVSAVSRILRDHLGISLRTRRQSKYRLDCVPKYCVIVVRKG